MSSVIHKISRNAKLISSIGVSTVGGGFHTHLQSAKKLYSSTSTKLLTSSSSLVHSSFLFRLGNSTSRSKLFPPEVSNVGVCIRNQQSFTHLQRSFYSTVSVKQTSAMKDWDENLDPVQKKLLEEECILLDDNDKVIGHDSKKNCHLIRNGDVLLHRAFSVFLFNSKGELLLQQRSKTKITFPLMWTNTCCSHPLYYADEMVEEEAHGIKVAAKRRLEIELGISPEDINLSDFHYLTRIHYKALSNTKWGEHEIDYILFLQKDLDIAPNVEEVAEIRYVSLDQIKKMANIDEVKLTPWFELIYKTWLPLWWNNLNNLKQFDDHKTIHKM